MKQIACISENKNYSAVNIGSLEKLTDYSFIHPKTKQQVIGKVFVNEATKATGTEIHLPQSHPRQSYHTSISTMQMKKPILF